MTGPIGYGGGVWMRWDGLVALRVLGALVMVGPSVVAAMTVGRRHTRRRRREHAAAE